MGSWSHEPFGNDTAADWAYGLDNSKDLAYVEAAIDRVLATEDYLDADIGEEAIAAIEVIAKMLGKGTQADAYTEGADIWVAAATVAPSLALRDKAMRALDRITAGESELAELWAEGEAGDEWALSVARLRAAITG
jgi:hypothetical protein